jgi:hypothetical protein
MNCEFCGAAPASSFYIGGNRPGTSYAKAYCLLCRDCAATAVHLIGSSVKWREDKARDTTNSRYSKLKAAVKRRRFGDANISIEKIRPKTDLDLSINEWL